MPLSFVGFVPITKESFCFFIPVGDNLGEEKRKRRVKEGIYLEFRESRRMKIKTYQLETLCSRYTSLEKVDLRNQ